MPPKQFWHEKKIWINKAVKGEKAVRKGKSRVPIRYTAHVYQFIDIMPLPVGRSFSLDQEDPPYVDELQQLFLHSFDFTHFRQNNCQNTANQYLC